MLRQSAAHSWRHVGRQHGSEVEEAKETATIAGDRDVADHACAKRDRRRTSGCLNAAQDEEERKHARRGHG